MRATRLPLSCFSLLGVLALFWSVPGTASAAKQKVPNGRWEIAVSFNAKTQYLRGPISYTFTINLKENATGSMTVALEYQGTEITDGTLKGSRHVKAVISRPVSNATFDGTKLFLYSGGDFKLIASDPPGHTIKEYATAGGLFPEVTINKLLESFYGVMVFTLEGENLVFVSKGDGAGKKLVWKKVR